MVEEKSEWRKIFWRVKSESWIKLKKEERNN